MMGFDADALGNHEFDRGAQYLRRTLIPASDHYYLSANVVHPATLKTSVWKPSYVFNFPGFKLGVVGYTLPELPTLIFPGYLDPFIVTDPVQAVNVEAARLRTKGRVNAIVALGHIGATGGTLTSPDETSPLITFADQLEGVDLVFGGHTHTQ